MTRLEQIKYVKEKANIVDVIGHFVQLKRDGSGYKGMSPFTNERTGSFTVHPAKNIFKCFSSGKGGDVIDFIMMSQGYNYSDALSWLVNFCNMPPEDNNWNYTPQAEVPISYINSDVMYSTIRTGASVNNNFYKWLVSLFGQDVSDGLVRKYNIGTSKHWNGANIFWQVDTMGYIRGGKIMCYNPETGKRIKDPEPLITWVHKAGRMKDYNLSQCLFGEHLIDDKPIKIVESEKTAILASVVYPDYTWLASCSLSNLSVARCNPLRGRKIALIPDCGAEQQWLDKATQLRNLISPDCFVDCIPGTHEKGYDLCDYILEHKFYLK